MTSDEPRGARALLAEMNALRARAHHGALSLFPQVRALLAEMEQQVSPMHANAHHGAARMHVLTTTPCACTGAPRRRAHARAHHDAPTLLTTGDPRRRGRAAAASVAGNLGVRDRA